MLGFLFKQKRRNIEPPKSYFMELTNFCNLKCIMCNFHSPSLENHEKRPKGFMDTDLAKEILDQIGRLGVDTWVALHGAGEPILHRDLIEILTHAGKYKNIKCGFLTNAMLLDREVSKDILQTGIAWIGFSIDGMNKQCFEKYRLGSDFDRIVENVLGFLELLRQSQKRVKTFVNMTVQQEMQMEIEDFIDFWLARVDEVAISPCRPIGSRKNVLVEPTIPRQPCYMLYEMMVIFWDGEVGLCCEDWFNSIKLGNLKKYSIDAIWYGKAMEKIRNLHEKGQYYKIALCRDCNSWYRCEEKEVDFARGCTVQKNAWQHVYSKI